MASEMAQAQSAVSPLRPKQRRAQIGTEPKIAHSATQELIYNAPTQPNQKKQKKREHQEPQTQTQNAKTHTKKLKATTSPEKETTHNTQQHHRLKFQAGLRQTAAAIAVRSPTMSGVSLRLGWRVNQALGATGRLVEESAPSRTRP